MPASTTSGATINASSSGGKNTHHEIITDAGRNLCKGVCGTWRNEHNVRPSPELDVENRIAEFIVLEPFE